MQVPHCLDSLKDQQDKSKTFDGQLIQEIDHQSST